MRFRSSSIPEKLSRVAGQTQALPGDYVYLSVRKLHEYCAQMEIDTAGPGAVSSREASAGAGVNLPPVELSAQYARRTDRVDPAWEEQRTQALLRRLADRLPDLPNLEDAEAVREGGIARFHRDLMLGIVHGDMTPGISRECCLTPAAFMGCYVRLPRGRCAATTGVIELRLAGSFFRSANLSHSLRRALLIASLELVSHVPHLLDVGSQLWPLAGIS
jgi:hypothetical protein